MNSDKAIELAKLGVEISKLIATMWVKSHPVDVRQLRKQLELYREHKVKGFDE